MKSKKLQPKIEKTVSVIVSGTTYSLSLVNGKAKMTRWNE